MCHIALQGKECPHKTSCKFSHDIENYLKDKKGVEGECYIYKQNGWCPFGFACLFLDSHYAHGKLLGNESNIPKEYVKDMNCVSKDLLTQLRKREVKCPQSEPIIAALKEEKEIRKKNPEIEEEATLFYKETRLKKKEKKKIDFKGKLYLAPLTTNGNLPFRRICKILGADITIGEMALATNLLQGHASEWALVKRHPSEDLFGVQITGGHADTMAKCAEVLDQNLSIDFIDINAGCPIDLIYNKGCGSALLDHKRKIWDIAAAMDAVTNIPITLKMRIGKDEKAPVVHKWIHEAENYGIAALTLHGRSRNQRYSKESNWDYISQCAKLTKLPLFGNGDIFNYEEYYDRVENYGVSGCMIARAALIKPWIFREIKEKRHWDISSSERLDMLRNFVNFGLEHWGSDERGVLNTRVFLLEWLSFLYRYIPIGLLETLPSTIFHRTSKRFSGRDELETTMASPDVKDWIKITEMLLGPVSDTFTFTPKHKSSNDSNG